MTISIEIVIDLDLAKLLSEALRRGLEVLLVSLSPPVVHIASSVKLATLIVKAVRHLMTDDHTDSTIVDSVISVDVKEWRL